MIPEICIRRPVFATVISLLLVLVGWVSFERLPVREYPDIDEPVISVSTTYTGADADIVETQVTQILEDSIAGIDGIEVLTSRSRAENSRITARFNLNADPDSAASDVRDRVARVRGRLPDEIDEPVVAKVEADAQPIMYLTFTSDKMSSLEMTDYANRYVIDQLRNVAGVADVQIFGERRYSMRIWVDPARLAAYALTVQDIEDALRKQNIDIPAGRIESVDREFTVLSRTGLTSPDDFRAIVVKEAGGALVRLEQVAAVELGPRDERRETRFNGKPAVSLGIIKQATANPLDVSSGVADRLPPIRSTLPAGLSLDIGYDSSIFIRESIRSVFDTIFEAVALVALVVIVFLRSARASVIPLVTIPVSLVATFSIMALGEFSINTLTLLAMVLAIGLVVDDAIVVLENAHRHIEAGLRPLEAALKGSREIAFAIVAMTVTLAAVYAPVAFNSGRTGRLFTEFAATLAGAVIISGIVALTLTPMMCSRLLRPAKHRHTRVSAAFDGLVRAYARSLRLALAHEYLVAGVFLFALLAGWQAFTRLNTELAPVEDRGVLVQVARAPDGSTIQFTARNIERIAEIAAEIPEVETTFSVAGAPDVTDGIVLSRLKHWNDRRRSQQQIAKELAPRLKAIPGIRAFINNPPPFGLRTRGQPVQLVIGSSRPYAEIAQELDKLLALARDLPGLANIDTDLQLAKPQLDIHIDRDKAASMGVTIDSIGRTLETLLGGRQVTRFNMNGEQYDVVVQVPPEKRRTPEDASLLFLRASSGEMIQLTNLVSLAESVAPKELNRFNQLRAATVSANLAPGYTLGEALDSLTDLARRVLPADFRLDYDGQSRELKTASGGLFVIFLLALAFIFLVLAAQFESFIDPVIIMATVPFSMLGAFAALLCFGGTLNIYSQIGLVTLIGLITKHGILIVEFANRRRVEGLGAREAVIEAAALRFRPIMMTTMAMVLGALPLALAVGAGAESRRQIGWVVTGGMSLGTIFTLYAVPAVYVLISRRKSPTLSIGVAHRLGH
jgi:multidrug efflux pump